MRLLFCYSILLILVYMAYDVPARLLHHSEMEVVVGEDLEDVISVEAYAPHRLKRRAKRGRKKSCTLTINGTDVEIPLNTLYTSDFTPCIQWKCYFSGRMGLLRYKSGCSYNNTCIKWDPRNPQVQKTELPCDQRICRIHWNRQMLQYGLVSPVDKAECEYNGTCYKHGEKIDFPENCTSAVCEDLPMYRRWMRRPMWSPKEAGCNITGGCIANGQPYQVGQCLEYTCVGSVKKRQSMLGDKLVFNFESHAEVKPTVEGCEKTPTGCLALNKTEEIADCVEVKCVMENNNYHLKKVKEGCRHNGKCKELADTFEERCVDYTCILENGDYILTSSKVQGCPNYFDPTDMKCYGVGQTITSSEEYAKSKGCTGVYTWDCDESVVGFSPVCTP